MTSRTLGTAALLAAFLAVGALAWGLTLRPSLQVDASALARLPVRFDSWVAEEVPLEETVESILRADFNIQRLYRHPLGGSVWLYIGYYGTERGGEPEHTPAACYEAHGWRIESSRHLAVAGIPGLRVNEYVVSQGGEWQLVHFWFRSYRRTGLLGAVDRSVDRLLGRLSQGRADGALIRLSTGLAGRDVVPARARLLGFAAQLEPALSRHWPSEIPVRR